MNALNKYGILINDPLGCGFKTNVKGMTSMSHERNLSAYAEELVCDYAIYECGQYELSFNDLPDEEQNELARLYMEFTGRDTGECVHGNDFSTNNEYTCALLAMLQDDSQENREKFAEITRKNIINYYSKSLQEVLNEACHTYLHSMNNEQGYYSHRDMEHGDFHGGNSNEYPCNQWKNRFC